MKICHARNGRGSVTPDELGDLPTEKTTAIKGFVDQ
jgi:hypothetical protein